MNKEDKIFEALITGGLIGASLGALLSGRRNSAVLGAIAGAAILATFNASEQARQMNVPLYVAENGKLYEIKPDGTKVYVRDIPNAGHQLKKHYKLR